MPKTKEVKQEVDETAIQNAIQDFKSGKFKTIAETARFYGLVPNTLRFRYNGGLPRKLAHTKEQLLSPEQEDEIVNWIVDSDADGHGRSRSDIIAFAELMLGTSESSPKIHESWYDRFKSRHDEIHTVEGRSISSLRAKAVTYEEILKYYRDYDLIVRQHKIPHENIFNYDESGFIMGKGKSSRVAVPSYKNRTYVQSTEGRDSCTVIEAISMSGEALVPAVIFKGGSLRTGWFKDDAPDWYYTASKRGFTTNWLSLCWLKDILVPQVKEKTSQGKVMLIMDGHGSHKTDEFRETCEKNNIIPMYLPPHSTHLLQPLDLGIFGPVKSRYKTKLSKLAGILEDTPVRQRLFIMRYHEARQEKLTKERIIKSWETAGLNPFDPDKVLKSSQLIVKQINDEIDQAEKDRERRAKERLRESEPSLEKLTKSQMIEKYTKDVKMLKSRICFLEAMNARLQFDLNIATAAAQNKKPEGVSSAIPMGENKGFKQVMGYIKEIRKDPKKKRRRKALGDITNTSKGSNSYTNFSGS